MKTRYLKNNETDTAEKNRGLRKSKQLNNLYLTFQWKPGKCFEVQKNKRKYNLQKTFIYFEFFNETCTHTNTHEKNLSLLVLVASFCLCW